MKDLKGSLIRQARKKAGMTLKELSDKLGGELKPNELSAIETKDMEPVPEVQARIRSALGKEALKGLTEQVGLSGPEIRAIRDKLGLTREKLAEQLGIKPSTLHNVELDHQRLGPAAQSTLQVLAGAKTLDTAKETVPVYDIVSMALEMASNGKWEEIRKAAETLEENPIHLAAQHIAKKLGIEYNA